jgi:hypothetical protein
VKKPKKDQSSKKQVTTFRRAARELGCDGSEERFDAALKTVAKHKPNKDGSKQDKQT